MAMTRNPKDVMVAVGCDGRGVSSERDVIETVNPIT